MARWQVDLYTFDGTGGIADHYQIENAMLSAKLVKTLDDTAKLTFSVPMNAFSGAFANILPMKAYVNVHRIGTTTKKFFCGLIEKRTLSLANMTYTYECCGGLGAQKYMAPARNIPSTATVDEVIDILSGRYRGTAVSPYSAPWNPATTLFTNINDLLYFGSATYTIFSVDFNDSLANLQKSVASQYEFYKALIDTENLAWPINFDQPHLLEDERGAIRYTNLDDTPNTQEIRYDKNLISFECVDEAYMTVAQAIGNGQQQFMVSAEYPLPFGYKGIVLPDMSGRNYTSDELKAAAQQILEAPHQIITAVGFDAGIMDDGTDFLNIQKPVYLVYLENNIEKRILANITSITYDLTNPSRDRVQLGKKVIPFTQRS